jgi:DedD protein
MAESSDAQLQLKKRARRRLVGAIAFAGLAAVVLPMVMDDEPKQQVQDIQIRIPGQDVTPFAPKALTARPPAAPAPAPLVEAEKPVPAPAKAETVVPAPTPAQKPRDVPVSKPIEKAPEKAAEKKTEKAAEKKVEKAAEKPAQKTPDKAKNSEKPAKAPVADAQRAAAILGDASDAPPNSGAGQHAGQQVILIGAFANPANVKQLQSKIGELGIKTYTEPLDSPQGKKTRLRAGPFPNREAADKALDRLKRIGVAGVVAGK